MPSLTSLEQNCIRDYRKYADTVAVLSAIHNLIKKNPNMARFIGIEHKLIDQEGNDVTPDLVALYDQNRKGLSFELKWSLPLIEEYREKKLKELKKYTTPFQNWRTSTGRVDHHDLVLVCHIDDAKRVIDTIAKISEEPEYKFFKSDGFAVWTWNITASKSGERKEELRFFRVYGKTRNGIIETMISEPGGILVAEDVLRYLRFTFSFIRQKPPVQYTMTILIQNIFSSFQQKPERSYYEIDTDLIYNRAKPFFPSWHESDTKTLQVKRGWIKEALQKLWELNIVDKLPDKPDWWRIPIPTLRTRRPTQEAICRKISKKLLEQMKRIRRRRGRVRIRPVRPKGPLKEKRLTEFM